jgi:TonB family protein
MPIILAYAEPAAVAPAPPRPSVITNPDWLRRPTGSEMAEFYPKAAAAARIEGHATLRCAVTASGDLADCTTANEEPLGQGFGEAALRLAPSFKMRPMTKDGVPVTGGKIAIPIRFAFPRPAPPAEVALRCYGYAAAEAERSPTSQQAQLAVLAFSLTLQMRLFPEHAKPSELAEVLASQQKIAVSKLDDPQFKTERDECATIMASRAGPEMQRLIEALTH